MRTAPVPWLTSEDGYSYVLGVKGALALVIAQGAGYRVTAVLTATSSTMPHSNTTQRTPHAHVVRSD
ncbi:MAG: hypothetical protein ACRDQX_02495 [Pseudonocardiaceae bacterium]